MIYDIATIVAQYKDHLTCKEMADEFGIREGAIREYCYKNGIELLGAKQYKLNYIRAMAGRHPIQWIADKIGMTQVGLQTIAIQAGISLGYKAPDEVEKTRVTREELLRLARIKERARELSREAIPPDPRKRMRDKYNQSGSPYGIADEMNRRLV